MDFWFVHTSLFLVYSWNRYWKIAFTSSLGNKQVPNIKICPFSKAAKLTQQIMTKTIGQEFQLKKPKK